jgi:hypothetical protein
VIVTEDADGGLDCPDDEVDRCQRAELRVAKAALPTYGDEVWYAFSFRIDANVPSSGSARTVIGQWKAPGDDSPFVAQRFDNGVFHVTVEDNGVRRVVAQAEGNPDRTVKAQDLLAKLDPKDMDAIRGVQSLQSFYQLKRDQPALSERLFSQELSKALEDQGSASTLENVAKLLDLNNAQLVPALKELDFVAQPERYIGDAKIRISPEAGHLLPDPRKDWVDMVYRVKGGRDDNEYGPRTQGELEIWANGEKITTVTGNLGKRLVLADPVELVGPYFKFGLYRLKIPGEFKFEFDEFSQSPSRAALQLSCLRGP